ncbi:MAG: YggS family pyridoxal phosphate-dependent enzyme [Roseiflexaceae bacterium]|jgi:pyridoxal phosphate enzyme (YggS family)
MHDALSRIQDRINTACAQANRPSASVRLIGVSKTHPASTIHEAWQAGLHDFGENRVQEAEQKILELAAIRHDITWHLIGHLQRNKAKRAVQLFDYIHSVDSLELAQALSRHCGDLGLPAKRILLQCNVSGEASKEGFNAQGWEASATLRHELCDIVERIGALPHLEIVGLMTVAPYAEDAETVRPVFVSLRQLRDVFTTVVPTHPLSELSMGMSGDVDVAIAEGATMVRVGRALFGERDYTQQ